MLHALNSPDTSAILLPTTCVSVCVRGASCRSVRLPATRFHGKLERCDGQLLTRTRQLTRSLQRLHHTRIQLWQCLSRTCGLLPTESQCVIRALECVLQSFERYMPARLAHNCITTRALRSCSSECSLASC